MFRYLAPVREMADLRQRLIDARCKASWTVLLVNATEWHKRLRPVWMKKNIFCRAMLCISAAYAVMWCLSLSLSVCVCLSVTFVSCVKTNKHIIKLFSPSGSHAILVFPCQTA